MAATSKVDFLSGLRGVLLNGHAPGLSDGQLMSRYLAARDEAAFAAIVRRHGGLVWGVCRRVLGDAHAADDAFQATFLVLVRKAATIVPRDNLAGWLHGVAYRTALKARTMNARRKAKEQHAAAWSASYTLDAADHADLRPILDRELAALPDCYRLPIVLCDLEGKSRKEAARQLGANEGTLSGRLARGRRLLAGRLKRRGVALSAAGLTAFLSQTALAGGPPATVMSATLKAGALFTVGGTVSGPVADLVREVLRAMLIKKLKSLTVLVGAVCVGLGLLAGWYGVRADEQPRVAQAPKNERKPNGKAGEQEVAGKIWLHRGQDLSVYDPAGKNFNDVPALDRQHRFNYQADSAKLAPDGRRLAFGQAEQGRPPSKIQIRDLDKDEAPTVLVSMFEKELSSWCWSPDGKKLTFAVWEEGDKKYHPWIADVATKKTEKVELPELPGKGEEGWGALVHAWTPDGLWVAFDKGHFHLVDPVSKATRRLNEEPTGFMSGSVRVAPDGKKLLYLRATVQNEWTLAVIDLLLGRTKVIAKLEGRARATASWSPDSRHIACSHADTDGDGRPQGDFRVEIYTLGSDRPRLLLQQGEWLTVTDWR
jgi:RNA polymerase sigma factor (sigma-70 family)